MDILKRSLAPITGQAWDELDEQASQILTDRLTARRFVDVAGPFGWDHGAITLGHLDNPDESNQNGVEYGIHQVLPLTEVRVPFTLSISDLDDISRGAEDADLEPLEEAARQIAAFEDRALYYGFKNGRIDGLSESSEHQKLSCPKDAKQVLQCVPEGISLLKQSSIEGPYALVVDPTDWRDITSYAEGYPLKRQVQENLDANLVFCPNIDDMFLVSERGGDFKLTLGGDLSLGYEGHTGDDLHLYFAESFTFRVLEPAAVVMFE